MSPRRRTDPARRLAYDVLRLVHGQGAYANLALAELLAQRRLTPRDAAFATELLAGTCRLEGTYRQIVRRASGRPRGFDDDVTDVLLLGCHQALSMRVPPHATVAASVDLAALAIGERVAGLVNAVLRRVLERSLDSWLDELSAGLDADARLALTTHHPRWVTAAYAEVLPAPELKAALEANNVPPVTTLAVRPGLAQRSELVAAGAEPTRFSPWGATRAGNPGDLAAIREGRAGVQDEGSQLVVLALSRAEAPAGAWLDLCAGPGGKSALLAGLAGARAEPMVANERSFHRAQLVRQAVRAYVDDSLRPLVINADGTRPAWSTRSFSRVLADVPCTGLGALRRRPESRWRRTPEDLVSLAPLQRALLHAALDSAAPGGVVAYVTCSPHRAETTQVIADVLAERKGVELLDAAALLPEVPDAALGPFVQLWPHRHGTDAMFLALLRTGESTARPLS